MKVHGAALALVAALASAAWATETPGWPPPPEVMARMRELQAVLASPEATKTEREAARSELAKLMKVPVAKKPARAAIDPYPSVVKPIGEAIPAPPVARIEVVPDTPPPPRPTINPRTGSALVPSPGSAVDPRTGRLLHEVPGGYIDPRTGHFVPK